MQLWLVDLDADLADAWAREFAPFPDVQVRRADILAIAENTIVSPANSYGWMDGGIDARYTEYFGLGVQAKLQRDIDERCGGRLPVGSAWLVKTGDVRIPYLISAPTMENPGPVGPENCYFAMSAVLKLVDKHRDVISRVFCPGLGTGIGKVDPRDAAREMADAFRKWTRVHRGSDFPSP